MGKIDKLVEEITGEYNTFNFDGLICNCYIRLESDNIVDITNAINKIYKSDQSTIYKEAQKELLLEMFEFGAWKNDEQYLEYINNKLHELSEK